MNMRPLYQQQQSETEAVACECAKDSGHYLMRRQPDDLFSSIEFLRVVLQFALSQEHSVQVWPGNFRRATRAGRNRKAEAMQFDDRGDHAQTQAQAFGVSSFV